QPLGRLPQAFQIVELARFLRENMDDKIYVVEQHPLRLLVALGVSHAEAECLQALIHRVGNRLDLPGIGPAAHHKVVGERSRILFQFENRDIVSLFVLAGEDGFTHLKFEVVLFLHTGSLIVTRHNPRRDGRPRRGPQTARFSRAGVVGPPRRAQPKPGAQAFYRSSRFPRYSPCFRMYSATRGSSHRASGLPCAAAARIAVAETFWRTPSSKCSVTPGRTRSPLAGCL